MANCGWTPPHASLLHEVFPAESAPSGSQPRRFRSARPRPARRANYPRRRWAGRGWAAPRVTSSRRTAGASSNDPLQRRRLPLAVRDDRQDLDREVPIHRVHARQPVALFERTGGDDGGFCADRRWGRLRQDAHLALAARAASAAHRADRNLGQAGGVEERLVGRTLDGSSPGFEADGVWHGWCFARRRTKDQGRKLSDRGPSSFVIRPSSD